VVPGWVTKATPGLLRAARTLIPTFIWVATPEPSRPKGPALRVPPTKVVPPPGRRASSAPPD
jgi:hypothetical protein